MKPAAPKKREWPRWAVGPLGNRAIFQCAGDVPSTWKLEVPLPGAAPLPPLPPVQITEPAAKPLKPRRAKP